MQTLTRHPVVAARLWPNAEKSEWFDRPSNRTFFVVTEVSAHGVHRVRTEAQNPLAHTFLPVTGPIADPDEAARLAVDLLAYLGERYEGGYNGPRWEHERNNDAADHVCPGCDRFGTLVYRQEAWADRTSCTECTYDHRVSIGD